MTEKLLQLTAEIVASYAGNNLMPAADVAGLVKGVHAALAAIAVPVATATGPVGATTVRKSLSNPAHIISMIDGKAYTTLTRHVKRNGYTPESYRQAFGLPGNYPMTASNYSAMRSELAKAIGLGRKKVLEPVGCAPDEAPAKRRTLKPRFGEPG